MFLYAFCRILILLLSKYRPMVNTKAGNFCSSSVLLVLYKDTLINVYQDIQRESYSLEFTKTAACLLNIFGGDAARAAGGMC